MCLLQIFHVVEQRTCHENLDDNVCKQIIFHNCYSSSYIFRIINIKTYCLRLSLLICCNIFKTSWKYELQNSMAIYSTLTFLRVCNIWMDVNLFSWNVEYEVSDWLLGLCKLKMVDLQKSCFLKYVKIKHLGLSYRKKEILAILCYCLKWWYTFR